MNLNSNNKSFIIYILLFVCVLFGIYLYNTNTSNNTQSNVHYVNMHNSRDGSTNLWYGLNAGGDYRGYGREYGGHLSPGRIYGHESK